MATTAARGATTTNTSPVERHTRAARWYHSAAYLLTTVELLTGWWLLSGREGEPTPLARAIGIPDTSLHVRTGLALLVLGAIGVTIGARASRTLFAESVRFDRSELGWVRAWPAAVFTGRFRRHQGLFDPGQRVANMVMVGGLAVLCLSGLALSTLHGGDLFVVALWIHKVATYVVTPVIVGHVIVASGLLPGYRGVWRAMHLGGRVQSRVADRLWPAWMQSRRGRPGAP